MKTILVTLSLTTSFNIFAQQFNVRTDNFATIDQFRAQVAPTLGRFNLPAAPILGQETIKVITVPIETIQEILLSSGDIVTPDELLALQPESALFQYRQYDNIFKFRVIDGKSAVETITLFNGRVLSIINSAMGGDMGGGGDGKEVK